MKISLKQARQVAKQLEQHIPSLMEKLYSRNKRVHLSQFSGCEQDVQDQLTKLINSENERTGKVLELALKSTDLLFSLRAKIDAENIKVGINQKLNELARLNKRMQLVKTSIDTIKSYTADLTLADFVETGARKISYLKNNPPAPSMYTSNDEFEVCFNFEGSGNSLKQQKMQLSAEIDKLTAEIAVINSSSTIELFMNDQKLLSELMILQCF